jgi:acetyl esterase
MSVRTRVERAVARTFIRLPTPLLRALTGFPRRSPEGYELDPEIQSLVWLMALRNGRDMHAPGLRAARRLMDHNGPMLSRPTPDVTTEDRTAPGAAGARRVRVYRPAAAAGRAAPGLVWFHGGGFALGSIESHDGICRGLAAASGVVVASVDYRLAPESKFPAAVEDAVAVTGSIRDAAASYGIDPRALAVGGDSAGGNLAAVTAQALRGSSPPIAFQLLVYPATDFTRAMPSHTHFSDGYILTKATIDWFMESYLPGPEAIQDPRASCLFATDVSGLPPAFVVTAGFDPLRDEGKAYADKMRAAGVAVEYVCIEGMVHGFFNMAGTAREPTRVLRLAADRLKVALTARAVGAGAPADKRN